MTTLSIILKWTILSMILLLYLIPSYAQSFNNHWIDYTKEYYKFKVAESGIYQITRNALDNAGIALNASNYKNLKLYSNGKEIPIHLEVQNNQLDYIEFYGEKNKGALDASLYEKEIAFNEAISLYSDSAAYFLVLENQLNTSSVYTNSNFSSVSNGNPEAYCLRRKTNATQLSYSLGTKHYIGGLQLATSTYDVGEGYGTVASKAVQFPIELTTLYKGSTVPVLIKANIAALRCKIPYNQNSHVFDLNLNGQSIAQESFLKKDSLLSYSIHTTNQQILTQNVLSIANTRPDVLYSVGGVDVLYPATFDFENKDLVDFELEASSRSRYLRIPKF